MQMVKNVLSRVKLISKGFTSPRPIGQVKITPLCGERKSFEANLLSYTKPYTVWKSGRGKAAHKAVNLIIDHEGSQVLVRVPTIVVVNNTVRRIRHRLSSILTSAVEFEGFLLEGNAPFPRVKGKVILNEAEGAA